MAYAVDWSPSAKRVVERLFQTAVDRDSILLTMWAIEASLRDDPNSVGESRPFDQRITYTSPLGVLFEVDEPRSKVEITSAWAIRRP